MLRQTSSTATMGSFIAAIAVLSSAAVAAQIQPGDFVDPLVFDFSDLPSGTRLGSGYTNPYAGLGVEFTGFVTNSSYGDIRGQHLASGFANSPPEPFVVRVRLLGDPALRIGGFVWPEYGDPFSVTAFDDSGTVIDRCFGTGNADAPFMGLESTLGQPIRSLEWRGLAGSSLTTFPRVDGVMIDVVPEPATLSFLALGGLALLKRRHPRT